MKKKLYILSALLLGLVSCNRIEMEPVETPKTEETGLVAITMKVQAPHAQLKAMTKAGDFSHDPTIDNIRVAVFGISGYPQAYAKAEPVDDEGNPLSDYATTNGDVYYFKVLLPVYDGEAHVHIIGNGPDTIKFVDETEDSIMETMRSENGVGTFWARVVMPDGILAQLDQNGIMQTDDEGNFIPSDGTAKLFQDLVLVRNFAEITLSMDSTVGNLKNVTWTLVNVPNHGSVAPMAAGSYVDDFKDYEYVTTSGKMVNPNDGKTYDGFMFDDDDPMNYDYPSDDDIKTSIGGSNYVYERYMPGTLPNVDDIKATCILLKGVYVNALGVEDSNPTYYRMDLMDETVKGYFPLYRNYHYKVNIHKVGNRGAKTINEAMNRDSGGNVSLSTEAKKLTDISDGESRLYVEYVEKNFTSGGKKTIWVQYVPDIKHPEVIDNSKIKVNIKTQGNALKEGTSITKLGTSSDTGYNFYQFELNDPDENEDLLSVLEIVASNYEDGETIPDGVDKSTLYRDINLRVLKIMRMGLSLKPKKVATGAEKKTILGIELPPDLPSSMFPLEFKIEDINHTVNPTGTDGNGNNVTVPVKTDKSLADGITNSFYYIRTVNEDEYKASNIINTEFQTISSASATTIYVANEYFVTEHTNLLNDGMYVNPINAVVPFNTTSVEVEVEFDDDNQSKTWTVTAGTGVTLSKTGSSGTDTFTMSFASNTSTTASVTRTAKVTCDGVSHDVTITQLPLEFTITPDTQSILFNATSAVVTVNAGDEMEWTARLEGTGATFASEDEEGTTSVSGKGSQILTVNFPVNDNVNSQTITVKATMTDPEAETSATIIHRGKPASTYSFPANSFVGSGTSYRSSSSDQYMTVDLQNVTRGGGSNSRYFIMGQTSYNDYYLSSQGIITVKPDDGVKITGITVTYSSNTYADYDATGRTVSSGSYSISGATGTWTGESAEAVVITTGYSTSGGYYSSYNLPRITSITVKCEPI